MEIAELKIEGFRGIRSGQVRFGTHTIPVGSNNCGKTTIIESIESMALLFGRDRMVRSLTEHDFHGSCPQPADRIRLIATIVGFEGDEAADHPAWFRDDRAVVKWWNPEDGTAHPARSLADWHLACQIAFSARFDRPSLEVETMRHFHDDDTVVDLLVDEVVTLVPASLVRDLEPGRVP